MSTPSPFFQAGGSLKKESPTYVERAADHELLKYLKNGEFCYVLNARQMGKSSLKVRAIQKLEQAGWHCADVDITAFGSADKSTTESWYFGFLYAISEDLGCDDKFEDWWEENNKFTPVARMSMFWEKFICQTVESEIAIFIDEIDSMLDLDQSKFNTDDFFAAIRAVYNKQADNPVLRRIHFCIIGVAAPNDLMSDPSRTPFNVGIPIKLGPIQVPYTDALLPGLSGLGFDSKEVLSEILHFSAGQPYMTQKICNYLSGKGLANASSPHDLVAQAVDELFLSQGGEQNLDNVQRRIEADQHESWRASMLQAYGEMLNKESIEVDPSRQEQLYLKLSGLIREENGRLVVFNPIYREVFNEGWLNKNLAKIKRPFSQDLQRWQENEEKADFLLRGEMLEQAMTWASLTDDLTHLEKDFLEKSRELEVERENRNKMLRRIFLGIAFTLAIIALSTAGFAIYQKNQADSGKVDADRAKQTALDARDSINILYDDISKLRDSLDFALGRTKVALNEAESLANENLSLLNQSERIQESFRLSNLAMQVNNNDPTLAVRLAINATEIDDNPLAKQTRNDIWKDQLFSTQIFWNKGGGTIFAAVFSPDNKHVLTAGGSRHTLILWDRASGNEIQRFEGHTSYVNSVAFSPDGKEILSGSSDNSIRLWDRASGQEIRVFEGHTSSVNSVAFSPNGATILSGSGELFNESSDISIRLWDRGSGIEIRRFEGHTGTVNSVAFSPDGEVILAGSSDSSIRIWDQASGNEIQQFEGHTSSVNAVAFSPDGTAIVSGSSDYTIRLWDRTSGNETQRFEGHIEGVLSVAFSPDGAAILSGSGALFNKSSDISIRLWDRVSGNELLRFEGHTGAVRSVAFSPDGEAILAGSSDHRTRLWDRISGNEIQRFEGHTSSVNSVAFSPYGKNIISGSSDNVIRLWDRASAHEIRRFKGHTASVRSVAFSPDGATILSGSSDNSIRLWDQASGKEIKQLKGHGASVWSVAFSHDGKEIVSGSSDNSIRLWDRASGKEIRQLYGHTAPVWSVAFSPDGKEIVSGSSDNSIRLWDRISGKEIRRLKGHTSSVLSVAFSPDGKEIVSGSYDKSIRLWDRASGKEIQRFNGHTATVRSVVFSPDGKEIVSGSSDNWTCNKKMDRKKELTLMRPFCN